MKFTQNAEVVQDKDLMFCKTVDCRNVLDKKDAKGKRLTCDLCKKDFCASCQGVYHPGKWCVSASDDDYSRWVTN